MTRGRTQTSPLHMETGITDSLLSLNSAYVRFFDHELENRNGDWKALLEIFLYSGEEPLIHGITGGREQSSLIPNFKHPSQIFS